MNINLDQNQNQNLSIVVPVYNECSTIETVVHKLSQLPNLLEIIAITYIPQVDK